MVKVGDIEVVPGFIIAETDLRERFSHSSGPGGQGVNTTDSRVELMFDVARSGAVPDRLRPVIMAVLKNRLVDGVLTVTVHDERSQLANRKLARARLVGLLQTACTQPRRRRATRLLVDPSVAAWMLRNGVVSSRGIVNVRRGDEDLSPAVQCSLWRGSVRGKFQAPSCGVSFCKMT